MNKKVPLLWFVLVTLTGCTSLQHVERGASSEWVPLAREHLLEEDVNVRTIDSVHLGGNLRMLSTDTLLLSLDGQESKVLELDSVAYIGQSPNVVAPILGGVVGIPAGLLIGFTVGMIVDPSDLDVVGYATGVGMLVGIPLGATIGGLSTKAYQYEVSAELPAVPTQVCE